MKIEDTSNNLVYFDQLAPGDCFKWKDSYYIVPQLPFMMDENCVNLQTGDMIEMNGDDQVVLLPNATLKV